MATTWGTGDLVEVRLNFAQVGESTKAMNVLHYRVKTAAPGPPGMSDILGTFAQTLYDALKAGWAVAASENVQFTSVTAQNVFPAPRSRAVTHTPGVVQGGDQVGEPLPLQDAPTLLKLTEVGERWGLGRLFYVGLGEAVAAGGLVNLVGRTALQNWANELALERTFLIGGWNTTLEPVLVRGPSNAPVSMTKILDMNLSDDIIKTQRRRRPGKGS